MVAFARGVLDTSQGHRKLVLSLTHRTVSVNMLAYDIERIVRFWGTSKMFVGPRRFKALYLGRQPAFADNV